MDDKDCQFLFGDVSDTMKPDKPNVFPETTKG